MVQHIFYNYKLNIWIHYKNYKNWGVVGDSVALHAVADCSVNKFIYYKSIIKRMFLLLYVIND